MASVHNEADPAVWGNYSIISSLADPMETLLYGMKRTVLQIGNFLPDEQLKHRQRKEMVEKMINLYTLENYRKAFLICKIEKNLKTLELFVQFDSVAFPES